MNDAAKPQRVLTRAEVVAWTRFSESTLARMCKSGGFPAPMRFGPRTLRWSAEAVEAWIAARAAEVTEQEAA